MILDVIIPFKKIAVWIHGWVFHLETGLIEDVILENNIPKHLQEAFALKF